MLRHGVVLRSYLFLLQPTAPQPDQPAQEAYTIRVTLRYSYAYVYSLHLQIVRMQNAEM